MSNIATISIRSLVLLAICCFIPHNTFAQDTTALKTLQAQASQALQQRDRALIEKVVQELRVVLADRAGVPEVPDELRPIPQLTKPWTEGETLAALPTIRAYIERNKWWHLDLEPTRCNHALREVAMIIKACIAASEADPEHSQTWIDIANDGGKFLIQAQKQAELGLYPFPAMRNGKGKPFEVAEAFMRRAERAGQLDSLIKNGWLINDLGDGGLQFDNGEAGVALLHLYEKTQQPQLLESVLLSAAWARQQPLVLNWNYNSFTVYLLAETYRVTGKEEYLVEAKERALISMLPGQLKDGPHIGRWIDPHNARPAYHYIMIRALLALLEVLPENDPDRSTIVQSIRLAFNARNPDYQKGIINGDSALEALLQAKRLPAETLAELGDCQIDSAVARLEAYGIEHWRTKNPVLGAGVWCDWLSYQKSTEKKE
jgi:hypothetical protein